MTDPSLSPASREAAAELGRTLKQFHRHISSEVTHEMQAELTELDLSFSQMAALHQLRGAGAMTVTQLAERIRLSLPASSHLVERLVQRGLVHRTENPDNRREKLVELSAAGVGVLEGMDSAFSKAYINVFAVLPAADLMTATGHLRHLLDQLEVRLSPPQPSEDTP
ncbi:MAG: MarR family transcriptional regulator [Deinococcus sp.]|uniref:MarR family winged helix-turn-helix transcriptional regulator n=1 Tax=Deinococcus sp. TaxID=47478 RepID=UPI0026DBA45C|nr:MarR family transcriptional regulator [Deinococcus sp.]MDO4246573.1 MarR family transcriptional regulator [Deinococcus sp.]